MELESITGMFIYMNVSGYNYVLINNITLSVKGKIDLHGAIETSH